MAYRQCDTVYQTAALPTELTGQMCPVRRARLHATGLILLVSSSNERLAEVVGFEPTRLSPQQISSLRRYDHFGTPPNMAEAERFERSDGCPSPAFEAGALGQTQPHFRMLVGEVGFEPTQPQGIGFTARPSSPTLALPYVLLSNDIQNLGSYTLVICNHLRSLSFLRLNKTT